jgi:hypothetical protein
MTTINAELALDFLKQLAAMHLRYPESTDYRRGAVDITNSMALYLEALIDDPADDRELAA